MNDQLLPLVAVTQLAIGFGLGWIAYRHKVAGIVVRARWDAMRDTPPEPGERLASYKPRLNTQSERFIGAAIARLFPRNPK